MAFPDFRFDPHAHCLVLAPHLEYPLRNGADILVDRKWGAFSRHVPSVTLVGKNTVTRYEHGDVASRTSFRNAHRSKPYAALRTLVRSSHYLLEKFLTPAYASQARRYLSDPSYGTVVFSYLCTATLVGQRLDPTDRLYVVETHNDDFKWFRNIRSGTRNPLARRAAVLSEQWTERFIRDREHDFLYVHVTEVDREGYAAHAPQHASLVVPIGVDIPPSPSPPLPPSETVRLLFVGALNTKMNLDALVYFRDRFHPVLADRYGSRVEVVVAGSNPTSQVQQLCRDYGWILKPDVPEDELLRLYEQATFAILPFAYATGAKLKLLKALASGVPFLATSVVQSGADAYPFPCLFSDDPDTWSRRIEEIRKQGLSMETRRMLVNKASAHSWDAVAQGMYDALRTRHASNSV